MAAFMTSLIVMATLAVLGHANSIIDSPTGDAKLCQTTLHPDGGGSRGGFVGKMETIPGAGWDNLRNAPMGSVLAMNYSQCRTTDDGRFLVPDSVNVYPVKTSRVDSYAEVINSWRDYTSTTSRSINSDLGFQGVLDISGTFSDEYVYTKTRQLEDDTITTRVQERYVRYRLVTQPDTLLDQGFKYRLQTIAASLELNDTHQARFDAQQLVREFGTHVTTAVEAGAAIVMEEQVSEDFTKVKGYSKSGLKSAARFSFASQVGLFWAGLKYQSSDQSSFNTLYMENRTDSLIRAFGGSVVNRTNFSRERWTDMIDKDLVAIDREGEPISSFITGQTLPEIPASTLLQLASVVKEAVTSYYRMNTHPGCTDKSAENFSPRANVDDGSCSPPNITSLKFGGLYQRCNNTKTDAGNLCESLTQNNPKTGLASCPNGYEDVPLLAGNKTHNEVVHVCKSCWLIFGHCCHDEVRTSSAHYEAFWCAALTAGDQDHHEHSPIEKDDENKHERRRTSVVKDDDGYMFGGVYTSHVTNVVTSSMTCPHAFVPIKVGEDLHVCLSDQYTSAVENQIPFAGFFSCQAGNPLALKSSAPNSSLISHVYTQGPAHWPRSCPIGYSPYMAAMTSREGCEVDYCIKPSALKSKKLPALRRPPFIQPTVQTPNPQNQFVFDASQNLWQQNEQIKNKSFLRHDWTMGITKNKMAAGGTGNDRLGDTTADESSSYTWLLVSMIACQCVLVVAVAGLMMFVCLLSSKLSKMEGSRGGNSCGESGRKGAMVTPAGKYRVNQVDVLVDEKVW